MSKKIKLFLIIISILIIFVSCSKYGIEQEVNFYRDKVQAEVITKVIDYDERYEGMGNVIWSNSTVCTLENLSDVKNSGKIKARSFIESLEKQDKEFKEANK